MQSQFWAVRDYLSPVLRESKFKETGCITPEEFVAAGDFLVYKFPVWSWEKGEAVRTRDFLPADKQYLVHRGVPCLRRASSLAYTDAQEDSERMLSLDGGNKDDDWVETHAGRPAHDAKEPQAIDDIPDLDGPSADDMADAVAGISLGGDNVAGNPPVGDIPDMDDIPDMEEADLEGEDDAAAVAPTAAAKSSATTTDANRNILSVRTYDVMITYDKYYQTPRVWLLGYDEKGTPLTHKQVFEDVSADHAQKTVTIESFPHSAALNCASVHPCKHASVMKKVIERMNAHVIEEQRKAAGGSSKPDAPAKEQGKRKWLIRKVTGDSNKPSPSPSTTEEGDDVEGMRVDFYLVVFLKFIASIVPTIEVDSTTAF
ncbi:autophagocytosis associated protein [Auriculariales sp. MPI-PUGE-AT-0066]|nr:autophagocytosis associated protein [Auriculariales sp. MPI-PUGE-AT-0066]